MEYLFYSGDEILERVDEYTLYCSYLGFEPLIGAKYHSPIRKHESDSDDSDPSFGVYERKYGTTQNEFMWKDQGLGLHGDIFDLVKHICGFENRRKAMYQVMIDAGIIPGTTYKPVPSQANKKSVGCSSITIMSKPFSLTERRYWERINVSEDLLKDYDVHSVKMFWLYADQNFPQYPKGMGFAYKIWDKYQIYQPFADKRHKWKTDWTDVCVPGFLQLKYNSPLLIITKSMKDVIVLRSFGYEAIAPRGENILLPSECIQMMKRKYERILVLFDNDGKHKGNEYEFNKIFVPKNVPSDKDVSDFCVNHGIAETQIMLQEILN